MSTSTADYLVKVTIVWQASDELADRITAEVQGAIPGIQQKHPEVAEMYLGTDGVEWYWNMTISAADAGHAALAGVAAARESQGGWNMAHASVTADPA